MADVNKIPGATPSPSSRDGQEVSKPGTKQFRDLMKVGKSDEEQKKRKKRQEEAEEEAKASIRASDVSRDKTVEATKKTEKFPKIQKVGESEKRERQESKRPEETEEVQEIGATTPSLQPTAPVEKPVEKVASSKGATPVKPPVEEEIIAHEIAEKEEEKVALQPFKKSETKKETPEAFIAPVSSPLGPLFIGPAPESAPAYTLLKPEVLALFERMVGQILVMQTNGITETSFLLNTPEFASSIFAGSQIIIREFSTAPLAYNIEFIGTDQNIPIFDRNIEGLKAVFGNERRNFIINRIYSSHRTEERPLFHRKEHPTDEQKK